MRRGAALATPAAAARLGPERRAGGYWYAEGREARAGQRDPRTPRPMGGPGGKGDDDRSHRAPSPPFSPPSFAPSPEPPVILASHLGGLPFPSPTPLQIPRQHLPARGLCVASLHTSPPCPNPQLSSLPHATPISIPLPIPPSAKDGEGDPQSASREWLRGRGRRVPSVSYPLSRSGSPIPAEVAQGM